MPLFQPIKQIICVLVFIVFLPSYACASTSIERTELVTQQVQLLKNRSKQAQLELIGLQKQHDMQISQLILEKSSKSLMDKASLEISVAKSNLDTINVELNDVLQTISWLEKNIQELENQLNVLNVFGLKVAKNDVIESKAFQSDLIYQQKLLAIEKIRHKYLVELHSSLNSILRLRKENYRQLGLQLKTYRLLNVKQQQAKDELAYQEKQNEFLQELYLLNNKLSALDPEKSKSEYLATERGIFYANERSVFAYSQSLLARYKDQIQQMRMAVFKGTSISLLNEIGEQVLVLNKQILHLETGMKSRMSMLSKHVTFLSRKKNPGDEFHVYVEKLAALSVEYELLKNELSSLKDNLASFRFTLDKALESELSSRQGLLAYGGKAFVDMGKEILLVPALTFHIVKSLMANFLRGIEKTSLWTWILFGIAESVFILVFVLFRKFIKGSLSQVVDWHNKVNSKWLSLQWLERNFIEFVTIWNLIGVMAFFGVPFQNYIVLVYLSLVWLIFKSILTISRVCLVETTHHTSGHDVRLYSRLKWIIIGSGVITAATVFLHQLPLIYELKTLADRLFLFCLMLVSLVLLRSWHLVPDLIASQLHEHHPSFQRNARFVAFLIPVLLLSNSIVGLFGYVNLIMTISSYEGIFLLVLIAYLTLRGFLSDLMDYLSDYVISNINNGWLWTQAFLRPIDTILRIGLFLSAWAVLFLLYGWDNRTPIVARLNSLLHIHLLQIFRTTLTPMVIIQFIAVVSVFYWFARWVREFVYRMLATRTQDMGLRNSIAILSQYSVIVLGATLSLRVLGIDSNAVTYIVTALAFGVGFGLRDLANNFVCGFLILLERPLRVGDIVSISNVEGEVTHIGSRAITVRTWDYVDLVVPNAEIFNKSFTNWTFKDNIVRSLVYIKIGRQDNPHEVKSIIQNALTSNPLVLNDPPPQVFLKQMDDIVMEFEVHYFVNIRQVKSRVKVVSEVLMNIWDVFTEHGIKPPYPQQEIYIKQGNVPVPAIT